MSSGFKYEKENIELRRGKVLELTTKGISQNDIAKTLNVSPALISLDLQWIREKSKKELETHISDRLAFEYTRAMEGLNGVLRRVSEIEDSATDNKTKLECSKLKMDLYRSMMSLATDGGIIERAMKMIKMITPLPGENLPTQSQEDKEDTTLLPNDSKVSEEESDAG